MSIGSIITAALPMLRANAESLMTDTCTIERLTTTWNESEQKSETTWAPVHSGIPCHLEEPSVTMRTVLTSEPVTLETPLLKLPVAYDGVQPDDRVTIAGHDVMWVTRAAFDDSTHPIEYLVQCRWSR